MGFKKSLLITAIQCGFLLNPMVSLSAATIHVPADYPTIQGGIEAASEGDTVAVAPGTYNENIDFIGKNLVVRSEEGPLATVIDGPYAENMDVVNILNQENSTAVFEGFTVTGENDGIVCRNSSPLIRGNIIRNTKVIGQGIFCYYGASPLFEGNLIIDNNTAVLVVEGAHPVIRNNIICENRGTGIWGEGSSHPLIEGNLILSNDDVGIWISGGNSHPTILNNIIAGNSMVGIQCDSGNEGVIIAFNTISGNAGGISCFYESSPLIAGNILTGSPNYGIKAYPNASPRIRYNCVWNNENGNYYGCGPGTGDISEDPSFAMPNLGEYRLLPDSPCIDSGPPSVEDPDGTRSDIGASAFDQSRDVHLYVSYGATVFHPGETAMVGFTLINQDSASHECLADVSVEIGDFSRLLHEGSIQLEGNSVIQCTLVETIPSGAPEGSCTYWAQILEGGVLLADDGFTTYVSNDF